MMKIDNNSPSFGSMQVRLSHMNRRQTELSDRLFSTIKYSGAYQKNAAEDLDIYILPAKSKKEIEVRFMDPYSGTFVRNENGKIIKEKLKSGVNEKIEAVADKVIEIYNNIVEGIVKRPKANISNVVNGNTEMAKMNPAKTDSLSEAVEAWEKIGYPRDAAEVQAYEEYKSLYHVGNHDADF